MGGDQEIGAFQIDIEQIFRALYDLITNADGSGLVAFLRALWEFFNFISVFLAPLLFFGIVYAAVRLRQVHKEEHEQFHEQIFRAQRSQKGDARWERIMSLANSDNPTEWRHAVIEADSLLDELLIKAGYGGTTLGERLQNVPRDRLRSLDAAWEAHKIRNKIAHEGSDFILTQREARKAIDDYRLVFTDLHLF